LWAWRIIEVEMAVFRYIGNNVLYDNAAPFTVNMTDSTGSAVSYSFTANVDFTVANDDSVISSLEFHIDPLTRENDFMRIS